MVGAVSASDSLAVQLFSELLVADQLARSRLQKALPKGMELSQFAVLNHLARQEERTPGQLAQAFNVTRGAMTNTLARLEQAGWVHIRPDWDDARRKMVAISPAGRRAWEGALAGIAPVIGGVVDEIGPDRVRQALPVLRALRVKLGPGG